MSRKDSPRDLIAAIYDAVIDASRWDEVVRRIVQATKSLSGALITEEADAAHVTAPYNVDPFYANITTNRALFAPPRRGFLRASCRRARSNPNREFSSFGVLQ